MSYTERKTAPFRADVVGSYLRPAELKEARAKFETGEITVAELTEVENKAIIKLVEQQKAAGLKVITDGEFRRGWWHLDFFWGLNGAEKVAIEQGYVFNDEVTKAESARLFGKLSGENHPFVEHFKFINQFKEEGIVPRQTIPSPAQFLAELQRPDNEEATLAFYPDEAELEKDIAAAYQKVLKDLYDAGCRNVQLDDCTWGMLVDPNFAGDGGAQTPGSTSGSACSCGGHHEIKRNAKIEKLAEQYLRVNNAAIVGLPADLVVTTHVCRGNFHSTWASSGGYDSIADVLFARENVSAYYLEFDTDRAGTFAPLKEVSQGKYVVLGLISSKIGALEDKQEVLDRIQEATKYVDLDHLCLSTQCGFASTEEGNILTEAEQWAKIAFVQEIAKEVWG